jgi:hypothetical protein
MVFESTELFSSAFFAAPFLEPSWGTVSLAIIVCLTVVLRKSKPDSSKQAADGTKRMNSLAESKESLVFVNALPSQPPDGTPSLSNALEPSSFDSGVCYGKFLSLHKPTDNPERCASGEYPYAAHMHGRRRNWEFRIQLTFRESIEGDFFFGAEQDRYYPVGIAERYASGAMISVLKRAATGMYQTHGDDPAATQGECERPEIVFPLWVMDQLIVTMENERPPSLRDPNFSCLGISKTQDRAAMRNALSGLQFSAGCTYTFGFWCVSPFVDGIAWSCKSPFGDLLPPVRLTDLGTHPPAFLTLYALKPKEQWMEADKQDGRHLDSRKVYLWRVAFWSSMYPPTSQRVRELIGEPRGVPCPAPTPRTAEEADEQQQKRKISRSCCSCGF